MFAGICLIMWCTPLAQSPLFTKEVRPICLPRENTMCRCSRRHKDLKCAACCIIQCRWQCIICLTLAKQLIKQMWKRHICYMLLFEAPYSTWHGTAHLWWLLQRLGSVGVWQDLFYCAISSKPGIVLFLFFHFFSYRLGVSDVSGVAVWSLTSSWGIAVSIVKAKSGS